MRSSFLPLVLAAAISCFNLKPLTAQIPARDLQVLAQLRGQTSYLGVALADVDADRLERLKLKDERGVEVISVEEGSPAWQAGIRTGDVLLAYNGETILGTHQLSRLVHETPENRKVKLDLWRDGKPHSVVVTVGLAPVRNPDGIPTNLANFNLPALRNYAMADVPTPILVWRNQWLGVQVEQLDQPLARFFGAKGGMLVRAVEKGSPADRAGLKVGDVITSVDSNPTLTARELTSYFRLRREPGRSTPVVVIRDHKELSLNVPPLAPQEQ